MYFKADTKPSLRRELVAKDVEIFKGWEAFAGLAFNKRHWAGRCDVCSKGCDMSYIIWPMIGAVIAVVVGAGPRRRAYRPNANSAIFAGAFGALVGGVIADGIPHAQAGQVTLISILGAMIGALIFCWAVRDRASDTEQ
jgi:uncharacterized membrane protein YeaQ/YmgE (transglycosylase-associated protein family)